MKVLAHRGYHANFHENTLESFHAAIALGVDGIETDVWLSADGIAVLFHDRFSQDGREVASFTHRQLCEAQGFHIPTLDEALSLSNDLLWNIELKSPAAAGVVAEAVAARKDHQFIITSFYHGVVCQLAKELSVDGGLLFSHQPLKISAMFPALGDRNYVSTAVWNFVYLDETQVVRSCELGLRTFVYGLHSQEDHEKAMQWDVDAVITDHPALALSLPR